MTIWPLAASLLLLTAQAGTALPALPPLVVRSDFDAVAADVAMVTDICFRLTTGELRWTPRNVNEEMAFVEAAGLTYGVPNGVIDTLGATGRISVNRATMASRSRAGYHVILTLGGQLPGCRVMLAGDPAPGMAQALLASLAAGGWTADVGLGKDETFERHLLMRNREGRWYRLDFALRSDHTDQLRALIGVSPANPSQAR